MSRRKSKSLQLFVGRQVVDPVSLQDAPGAHFEGCDRGIGEVGPGSKAIKAVVDKQSC